MVSGLFGICIGVLTLFVRRSVFPPFPCVVLTKSHPLSLHSFLHTVPDDETAKYLREAMSNELGAFDESEIVKHLKQVGSKRNTTISFDERVAEAIASLLGTAAI